MSASKLNYTTGSTTNKQAKYRKQTHPSNSSSIGCIKELDGMQIISSIRNRKIPKRVQQRAGKTFEIEKWKTKTHPYNH